MTREEIDRVKVAKDDVGEWWLEFYANDVRHQVTIEDVMNGLASFVNMQVTNAALHERIDDLESAQQNTGACLWTQQDDEESDNWESSCGDLFYFESGTPEENGMKFCPFCGKPLAWKLYEPELEE